MHFRKRKFRTVWTTKGLGDDTPMYWNRVGIMVPTPICKVLERSKGTVKYILERRKI